MMNTSINNSTNRSVNKGAEAATSAILNLKPLKELAQYFDIDIASWYVLVACCPVLSQVLAARLQNHACLGMPPCLGSLILKNQQASSNVFLFFEFPDFSTVYKITLKNLRTKVIPSPPLMNISPNKSFNNIKKVQIMPMIAPIVP